MRKKNKTTQNFCVIDYWQPKIVIFKGRVEMHWNNIKLAFADSANKGRGYKYWG